MITYVPNYYHRFQCIAGACRHTCCQGWEVDVDDVSLKRFEACPDIITHICDGSFVLEGEDERCPFLREDNLCQMIIDHGEAFICDICKDHPRFRNFYEDGIEMGVGLCCEAACELIVRNRETFELVPPRDLTSTIRVLTVRESDIMERFALIAGKVLDYNDSYSMYKEMECLDRGWFEILDKTYMMYSDRAADVEAFVREHSVEFEQIAVYYAYRYPSIPSFAVEAGMTIARVALNLGGSTEAIIEASRMYSSEVEYSDLNMDVIYDVFDIAESTDD